jgi:hypothetical protein
VEIVAAGGGENTITGVIVFCLFFFCMIVSYKSETPLLMLMPAPWRGGFVPRRFLQLQENRNVQQ